MAAGPAHTSEELAGSTVLQLSGHLFDSNLLSSVLDLSASSAQSRTLHLFCKPCICVANPAFVLQTLQSCRASLLCVPCPTAAVFLPGTTMRQSVAGYTSDCE